MYHTPPPAASVALAPLAFAVSGSAKVDLGDLSRATIAFTGTPELNRNERYPLLTSQTEITSAPHVATELPRGWKVMVRGGNTLSLMYSGGTLLYMR